MRVIQNMVMNKIRAEAKQSPKVKKVMKVRAETVPETILQNPNPKIPDAIAKPKNPR